MKAFDALVIGGGPAGAAAALRAAQLGCSVCLVDRSKPGEFKIGESLPPAATRLLHDLGASAACQPGIATPSFGNQSAWGSPELRDTDFIRDPAGHGWHVDRARFDATLREVASQNGVRVYGASVSSVTRTSAQVWRVAVGDETIEAPWVIDCAGRASFFARSQSVPRKSFDRLIAIFSEFDSTNEDSRTLVESAPCGWWYTSLLPGGRRVVVFHTDAGSQASRTARSPEGFRELLTSTVHVRDRVTGPGPSRRPAVASAATTRLHRFHGSGWFAAGDAATSFDPLSSQGIYTALYSGMKAAEAVADSLQDAAYNQLLDRVFDAYLAHRRIYYGDERRWPESPFWRVRQ
jgi:flavin-dependent dehydrogenase